MKKYLLLTLLSIACSASMFATHMAGGDIWYEYAGNAQFPHRYNIYVKLYRNTVASANLCNGGPCAITLCEVSSCYQTRTMTANLVPVNPKPGSDTLSGSVNGSILTPEFNDCTDPLSASPPTEEYLFKAQVDLLGICTDYQFSYSICCRNTSDNLLNSTSDNFQLVAKLDNTLGPNSSPGFINPGSKSLCLNTTYSWPQSAREPDGDSIYYSLSTPLNGTNCSFGNCLFAPGYSEQSPMTTSGPLVLNTSTGDMVFTTAAVEVVTFKLNASEYRLNSANFPILVGISSRDVQIPIIGNCGTPPQDWIMVSKDSAVDAEFHCNDSTVTIPLERLIHSKSVANDGTDFSLVNSQGNILPIIKAEPQPLNGQSLKANSIKLTLHQPIQYNDTLQLNVRVGSDLNTLISTCGYEVTEGDSVLVKVEDCTSSISLNEFSFREFSTYPNPAGDQLNFRYSKSSDLVAFDILDITGKKILDYPGIKLPESISVSQLPAGIYFIRISTKDWSQTQQFEKL